MRKKGLSAHRFLPIGEWFLRIAGMLTALVTLIWFAAPIFVSVINIGNIAGIILSIWLFIISCKPLQHALKGFCSRGFALVIYRFVNGAFIAFLAYGLVVTGLMFFAANAQPETGATALVLGAQVCPDGEPSSILRGRIHVAEQYLAQNPGSKAVLSGGKGADELQSEASCMFRVMTEDSVDRNLLYMEEKSTNTTENFEFSSKVIHQNGLNKNITVITDVFHQLRARIIFWKQGCQGRIGAISTPTLWNLFPTYVVREWFALPAQVFFR